MNGSMSSYDLHSDDHYRSLERCHSLSQSVVYTSALTRVLALLNLRDADMGLSEIRTYGDTTNSH